MDAKGLATVALNEGRRLLVAGRNDGPTKTLRSRPSEQRWLEAEPNDAYALIPRTGGTTEKREFYYGHTYLSHSSRGLAVGPEVDTVTVVDYRGNRRTITLDNASPPRTVGTPPPAAPSSSARP